MKSLKLSWLGAWTTLACSNLIFSESEKENKQPRDNLRNPTEFSVLLKMPKEGKKRGRREEKKRKREEENAVLATSKRQKSDDIDDVELVVNGDKAHEGENYDANAGPSEIPFYGLLDEDEQEYFKRADSMLELNQFANAEERSLFLNSVYKEANGKELKIANSQSCSRLMERLIMMSTPSQLKALFQKLSGQ